MRWFRGQTGGKTVKGAWDVGPPLGGGAAGERVLAAQRHQSLISGFSWQSSGLPARPGVMAILECRNGMDPLLKARVS